MGQQKKQKAMEAEEKVNALFAEIMNSALEEKSVDTDPNMIKFQEQQRMNQQYSQAQPPQPMMYSIQEQQQTQFMDDEKLEDMNQDIDIQPVVNNNNKQWDDDDF